MSILPHAPRWGRSTFALAAAAVLGPAGLAVHATATASTTPRGVLVFTANVNGDNAFGLYRANVNGGNRLAILRDDGRTDVFMARVSPDGSRVAAVVGRPGVYALRIIRIGGGMTTVETQRVTSTLRTYIQGVSWAPDGRRLVYGRGAVAGHSDTGRDVLRRVNTFGAPRPVTIPGSIGLTLPAYGPHGHRIAAVRVQLTAGHPTFSLVLFDPASRARRTLVTSGRSVGQPTWSPDGRRLAWAQETATGSAIVVRDNATGHVVTVVAGTGVRNDHPFYACDGRLFFDRSSPSRAGEIWTLSAGGRLTRITHTTADESTPSVSRRSATVPVMTTGRSGSGRSASRPR